MLHEYRYIHNPLIAVSKIIFSKSVNCIMIDLDRDKINIIQLHDDGYCHASSQLRSANPDGPAAAQRPSYFSRSTGGLSPWCIRILWEYLRRTMQACHMKDWLTLECPYWIEASVELSIPQSLTHQKQGTQYICLPSLPLLLTVSPDLLAASPADHPPNCHHQHLVGPCTLPVLCWMDHVCSWICHASLVADRDIPPILYWRY